MVDLAPVAGGAALAVVGGIFGLWMARRQWTLRREIVGAESVDAGRLRQGVVELSGTVVPVRETFSAPLTGRECVAYKYAVEQRHRSTTNADGGGSGTTWRQQTHRERAAPFYVDDGTGQALVDAPVAALELAAGHEVETDGDEVRPTGRLKGLVTGEDPGYDVPISDEVRREVKRSDRKRRYRERLVRPGESVYVYGEAMPPREATSEPSGLARVAGLVASYGPFPLSSVAKAVSGATGDAAEFRRASRRDPEIATGRSESDDDFGEARADLEERRRRLQELSERYGDDLEELPPAERRRVAEEMQEIAGAGTVPDSLGLPFGDAAGATGTEGRGSGETDATGSGDGSDGEDPFAAEDLVVSRGDAVGEFVVSDHDEDTVVRSYTLGTLKWLAVAVVCVAVGAYFAATGLDLVAVPGTAATLPLPTPSAGALAASSLSAGAALAASVLPVVAVPAGRSRIRDRSPSQPGGGDPR